MKQGPLINLQIQIKIKCITQLIPNFPIVQYILFRPWSIYSGFAPGHNYYYDMANVTHTGSFSCRLRIFQWE
jgi:hypothetical protein